MSGRAQFYSLLTGDQTVSNDTTSERWSSYAVLGTRAPPFQNRLRDISSRLPSRFQGDEPRCTWGHFSLSATVGGDIWTG